jgi:RNase P subunit RPR2
MGTAQSINISQAVEKTPCSRCKSQNTESGWTANVAFKDGREFKIIGVWCYNCDDIDDDFDENREYHEAVAKDASEWWKHLNFEEAADS